MSQPLSAYWADFLTLAVAHLLAVASPGPDLALVLRQGARSRAIAIQSSLGIGAGILVHVAYCLLGVGLIISQEPRLMNLLRLAGAAYLIWLGGQCLRSGCQQLKHKRRQSNDSAPENSEAPTLEAKTPGFGERPLRAFITGFLTNVLNPKATLFFLALYAVVPAPDTPWLLLALYGLWMSLATALWFIGISLLVTHHRMGAAWQRLAPQIDLAMGITLFLIGAHLVASTPWSTWLGAEAV